MVEKMKTNTSVVELKVHLNEPYNKDIFGKLSNIFPNVKHLILSSYDADCEYNDFVESLEDNFKNLESLDWDEYFGEYAEQKEEWQKILEVRPLLHVKGMELTTLDEKDEFIYSWLFLTK